MKSDAIGIFDSGLGGLTVQSEITRLLPGEDTIYLGDTARVPYGTKSSETVTRFSIEIADFLSTFDIKLLVVACNTASAYAIDALTARLDIPVVGVIKPGALSAVKSTESKKIGVIGTEGTIRSRAYEEAVRELEPDMEVSVKACPLFVPLVEEGFLESEVAMLVASEYLAGFSQSGIDTLVLGCTHYPLLKGVISKTLGPDLRLIDSALATAGEVARVLKVEGLLNEAEDADHRFFVTDSPKRFVDIGRNFLHGKLDTAELTVLGGGSE
jgi:glutamate racemase